MERAVGRVAPVAGKDFVAFRTDRVFGGDPGEFGKCLVDLDDPELAVDEPHRRRRGLKDLGELLVGELEILLKLFAFA